MSKSLVVEVRGSTEDTEICDKIQATLLALYERTESFSVYLTPGTKDQGLFSSLYKLGIVVEDYIGVDRDKQVEYNIFTS